MLEHHELDHEAFDRLLEGLSPDARIPVEQSPAWIPFDQAQPGRTSLGVHAYHHEGRPVALAHPVAYRQKFRDWVWLKHGPVWLVEPTADLERQLVDTLVGQLSRISDLSPLFLRLQLRSPSSRAVEPFEHTMYDRTVVVDLADDDRALRKSFQNEARRRIKQAVKNGVETREVPHDEAVELMRGGLHEILVGTADRSNFRVHGADTYEAMLRTLPGIARLSVASVQGKPVCWLISTEYRGWANYYYGAGNDTARATSAAYLLQWETMKALRSRGVRHYDLMGVASDTFPELVHVARFKKHFAKDEVELPPTVDIPLDRLRYKAVVGALTGRRAALAGVRKAVSGVKGLLPAR